MRVIGLTDDGRLVRFRANSPQRTSDIGYGNGILVATGKLGLDANVVTGFDIYSRLERGVTVSNHAFASLMTNGSPAFYRIHLTTGRAISLGALGETLIDIAIPVRQ